MLDDTDIKKLKEVLATKEDLVQLLTIEGFDGFRTEIKQELDGLRESIQALTISVDKLVKAVDDLTQEYAAVVSKIDRHEK